MWPKLRVIVKRENKPHLVQNEKLLLCEYSFENDQLFLLVVQVETARLVQSRVKNKSVVSGVSLEPNSQIESKLKTAQVDTHHFEVPRPAEKFQKPKKERTKRTMFRC